MGGNAVVNKALDTFWTDLNDGPASPYSYWDNQFEYALPWEYNFTGEPWKTQQLVNRIRTQLYLDAPAALGDNDDLGATSSMGVMTMLGMFPEYISTADVPAAQPLSGAEPRVKSMAPTVNAGPGNHGLFHGPPLSLSDWT